MERSSAGIKPPYGPPFYALIDLLVYKVLLTSYEINNHFYFS